jgi:two-component system, cell cycle response regulator DivK
MTMATPVTRSVLKDWVILVVDDEPDSLEVATRLLKHYSATVHTATNGQLGLEVARQVQPRFILTDLSMPVLDGWGFLYELQHERSTMEIPVFALTAHAMLGDRERAIAAGFHNYLTKPLTPATFITDLLRLIEGVAELAQYLNQSSTS